MSFLHLTPFLFTVSLFLSNQELKTNNEKDRGGTEINFFFLNRDSARDSSDGDVYYFILSQTQKQNRTIFLTEILASNPVISEKMEKVF